MAMYAPELDIRSGYQVVGDDILAKVDSANFDYSGIDFEDSDKTNGVVSFDGIADLELRLKCIKYASYLYSDSVPIDSIQQKNKESFELIKSYLIQGTVSLEATDTIVNFLEHCITHADDALLQLQSVEISDLKTCLDHLKNDSAEELALIAEYSKERSDLNQSLGISNKEIFYRNQAFNLDYHNDSVTELVQSLYDSQIIYATDTKENIIDKMMHFVQNEFSYVADQSGEDNWQNIADTIRSKQGDCEDTAIVLTGLLSNIFHYRLGYSKKDVGSMISLAAGTFELPNGAKVHHALTKIVSDPKNPESDIIYLDSVKNNLLLSLPEGSFETVFEINDLHFSLVGQLDDNFRTASNTAPFIDQKIVTDTSTGKATDNGSGKITDHFYTRMGALLTAIQERCTIEINVPRQYQGALYRQITDVDEIDKWLNLKLRRDENLTDDELQEQKELKSLMEEINAFIKNLDERKKTLQDNNDYQAAEEAYKTKKEELDGLTSEIRQGLASFSDDVIYQAIDGTDVSLEGVNNIKEKIGLSQYINTDDIKAAEALINAFDASTKVTEKKDWVYGTRYTYPGSTQELFKIKIEDGTSETLSSSFIDALRGFTGSDETKNYNAYNNKLVDYKLALAKTVPFKAMFSSDGFITKTAILKDVFEVNEDYQNTSEDNQKKVDAVWGYLISEDVLEQTYLGTLDFNEKKDGDEFMFDNITVDLSASKEDDGISYTFNLRESAIIKTQQPTQDKGLDLTKIYGEKGKSVLGADDFNFLGVNWEHEDMDLNSDQQKRLKKLFGYEFTPLNLEDGKYQLNLKDDFIGGDQTYISRYGLGIEAQRKSILELVNTVIPRPGDEIEATDMDSPSSFAIEVDGVLKSVSKDEVAGYLSQYKRIQTAIDILMSDRDPEKGPYKDVKKAYLELKKPRIYHFIDQNMILSQKPDDPQEEINNFEAFGGEITGIKSNFGFFDVHTKEFNLEGVTLDSNNLNNAINLDEMGSTLSYMQGVTIDTEGLFNYAKEVREYLNQFLYLFHIVSGYQEIMLAQSRSIHDMDLDSDIKNKLDRSRQKMDRNRSKFNEKFESLQGIINSGVDQIVEQIQSYTKSINEAIKVKKEMDVDTWARAVMEINQNDPAAAIGSFLTNFVVGGATDLIDELTGSFTLIRSKLKLQLHSFYTLIQGVNAHRGAYYYTQMLKVFDTVKEEFGSDEQKFYTDKQYLEDKTSEVEDSPSDELDPQTGEASTEPGQQQLSDISYGKTLQELLNYETDNTTDLPLVSRASLSSLKGFYNATTSLKFDLNESKLSNDSAGGRIDALLGKVLPEELNSRSTETYAINISSPIVKFSIAALKEEKGGTSHEFEHDSKQPLKGHIIGENSEDFSLQKRIDNLFESEKSPTPIDVLAFLLKPMQIPIEAMVKGGMSLFNSVAGFSGNPYAMYNPQLVALQRERIYEFQTYFSVAMSCYHAVAKAKLDQARQVAQDSGTKPTQSSYAVLNIAQQALLSEFNQLNASFQMLSQNSMEFVDAVNTLTKSRFDAYEAYFQTGLKSARTTTLIVVMAAAKGLMGGFLASAMAGLLNPATAAVYSPIAAAGDLDPSYSLFAIGTTASYMLETAVDAATYMFKIAMKKYQNPITMLEESRKGVDEDDRTNLFHYEDIKKQLGEFENKKEFLQSDDDTSKEYKGIRLEDLSTSEIQETYIAENENQINTIENDADKLIETLNKLKTKLEKATTDKDREDLKVEINQKQKEIKTKLDEKKPHQRNLDVYTHWQTNSIQHDIQQEVYKLIKGRQSFNDSRKSFKWNNTTSPDNPLTDGAGFVDEQANKVGRASIGENGEEGGLQSSFIRNQGDGKVVQNGLAMAYSTQESQYHLMRIRILLLILKVLMESIEQAAADFAGMSKPDGYGRLENFSVMENLISLEMQVYNDYKQDVANIERAWNSNVSQDKDILHALYNSQKSALQGTVSYGTWVSGWGIGAATSGALITALDVQDSTMKHTLDYGGIHATYDLDDKNKVMTEKLSGDEGVFQKLTKSSEDARDKINAKMTYQKNSPVEGDLTPSLAGGVAMTDQNTFADKMYTTIASDNTMLKSFVNGKDINPTDTNIKRIGSDPELGLDSSNALLQVAEGMEMKMVNLFALEAMAGQLTKNSLYRILYVMLEVSRYNIKKQIVEEFAGQSSGTNTLQSIFNCVDHYNSLQMDVMQDISTNWSSRATSNNEREKTEILMILEAAIISTFSLAILFNQWTALIDPVLGPKQAQAQKGIKSFATNSAEYATLKGIGQFISDVILFAGSIKTFNKINLSFAEQNSGDKPNERRTETEEESQEDASQKDNYKSDIKAQEKKLQTSRNTALNGAFVISPRGQLVVNKSKLSQAKSAIKKRFRLIKLMQELMDKENSAIQEVAAEISGMQSTGAGKNISRVFGVYERGELAKLEAMFKSAEDISNIINQALDSLKGSLIKILIKTAEEFVKKLNFNSMKEKNYAIEAKSKTQQRKKERGDLLAKKTGSLTKIKTKLSFILSSKASKAKQSAQNSAKKSAKNVDIDKSKSLSTRSLNKANDFLEYSGLKFSLATMMFDKLMAQSIPENDRLDVNEVVSEGMVEDPEIEQIENFHIVDASTANPFFTNTVDLENEILLADILKAKTQIMQQLLSEFNRSTNIMKSFLQGKFDKKFGKDSLIPEENIKKINEEMVNLNLATNEQDIQFGLQRLTMLGVPPNIVKIIKEKKEKEAKDLLEATQSIKEVFGAELSNAALGIIQTGILNGKSKNNIQADLEKLIGDNQGGQDKKIEKIIDNITMNDTGVKRSEDPIRDDYKDQGVLQRGRAILKFGGIAAGFALLASPLTFAVGIKAASDRFPQLGLTKGGASSLGTIGSSVRNSLPDMPSQLKPAAKFSAGLMKTGAKFSAGLIADLGQLTFGILAFATDIFKGKFGASLGEGVSDLVNHVSGYKEGLGFQDRFINAPFYDFKNSIRSSYTLRALSSVSDKDLNSLDSDSKITSNSSANEGSYQDNDTHKNRSKNQKREDEKRQQQRVMIENQINARFDRLRDIDNRSSLDNYISFKQIEQLQKLKEAYKDINIDNTTDVKEKKLLENIKNLLEKPILTKNEFQELALLQAQLTGGDVDATEKPTPLEESKQKRELKQDKAQRDDEEKKKEETAISETYDNSSSILSEANLAILKESQAKQDGRKNIQDWLQGASDSTDSEVSAEDDGVVSVRNFRSVGLDPDRPSTPPPRIPFPSRSDSRSDSDSVSSPPSPFGIVSGFFANQVKEAVEEIGTPVIKLVTDVSNLVTGQPASSNQTLNIVKQQRPNISEQESNEIKTRMGYIDTLYFNKTQDKQVKSKTREYKIDETIFATSGVTPANAFSVRKDRTLRDFLNQRFNSKLSPRSRDFSFSQFQDLLSLQVLDDITFDDLLTIEEADSGSNSQLFEKLNTISDDTQQKKVIDFLNTILKFSQRDTGDSQKIKVYRDDYMLNEETKTLRDFVLRKNKPNFIQINPEQIVSERAIRRELIVSEENFSPQGLDSDSELGGEDSASINGDQVKIDGDFTQYFIGPERIEGRLFAKGEIPIDYNDDDSDSVFDISSDSDSEIGDDFDLDSIDDDTSDEDSILSDSDNDSISGFDSDSDSEEGSITPSQPPQPMGIQALKEKLKQNNVLTLDVSSPFANDLQLILTAREAELPLSLLTSLGAKGDFEKSTSFPFSNLRKGNFFPTLRKYFSSDKTPSSDTYKEEERKIIKANVSGEFLSPLTGVFLPHDLRNAEIKGVSLLNKEKVKNFQFLRNGVSDSALNRAHAIYGIAADDSFNDTRSKVLAGVVRSHDIARNTGSEPQSSSLSDYVGLRVNAVNKSEQQIQNSIINKPNRRTKDIDDAVEQRQKNVANILRDVYNLLDSDITNEQDGDVGKLAAIYLLEVQRLSGDRGLFEEILDTINDRDSQLFNNISQNLQRLTAGSYNNVMSLKSVQDKLNPIMDSSSKENLKYNFGLKPGMSRALTMYRDEFSSNSDLNKTIKDLNNILAMSNQELNNLIQSQANLNDQIMKLEEDFKNDKNLTDLLNQVKIKLQRLEDIDVTLSGDIFQKIDSQDSIESIKNQGLKPQLTLNTQSFVDPERRKQLLSEDNKSAEEKNQDLVELKNSFLLFLNQSEKTLSNIIKEIEGEEDEGIDFAKKIIGVATKQEAELIQSALRGSKRLDPEIQAGTDEKPAQFLDDIKDSLSQTAIMVSRLDTPSADRVLSYPNVLGTKTLEDQILENLAASSLVKNSATESQVKEILIDIAEKLAGETRDIEQVASRLKKVAEKFVKKVREIDSVNEEIKEDTIQRMQKRFEDRVEGTQKNRRIEIEDKVKEGFNFAVGIPIAQSTVQRDISNLLERERGLRIDAGNKGRDTAKAVLAISDANQQVAMINAAGNTVLAPNAPDKYARLLRFNVFLKGVSKQLIESATENDSENISRSKTAVDTLKEMLNNELFSAEKLNVENLEAEINKINIESDITIENQVKLAMLELYKQALDILDFTSGSIDFLTSRQDITEQGLKEYEQRFSTDVPGFKESLKDNTNLAIIKQGIKTSASSLTFDKRKEFLNAVNEVDYEQNKVSAGFVTRINNALKLAIINPTQGAKEIALELRLLNYEENLESRDNLKDSLEIALDTTYHDSNIQLKHQLKFLEKLKSEGQEYQGINIPDNLTQIESNPREISVIINESINTLSQPDVSKDALKEAIKVHDHFKNTGLPRDLKRLKETIIGKIDSMSDADIDSNLKFFKLTDELTEKMYKNEDLGDSLDNIDYVGLTPSQQIFHQSLINYKQQKENLNLQSLFDSSQIKYVSDDIIMNKLDELMRQSEINNSENLKVLLSKIDDSANRYTILEKVIDEIDKDKLEEKLFSSPDFIFQDILKQTDDSNNTLREKLFNKIKDFYPKNPSVSKAFLEGQPDSDAFSKHSTLNIFTFLMSHEGQPESGKRNQLKKNREIITQLKDLYTKDKLKPKDMVKYLRATMEAFPHLNEDPNNIYNIEPLQEILKHDLAKNSGELFKEFFRKSGSEKIDIRLLKSAAVHMLSGTSRQNTRDRFINTCRSLYSESLSLGNKVDGKHFSDFIRSLKEDFSTRGLDFYRDVEDNLRQTLPTGAKAGRNLAGIPELIKDLNSIYQAPPKHAYVDLNTLNLSQGALDDFNTLGFTEDGFITHKFMGLMNNKVEFDNQIQAYPSLNTNSSHIFDTLKDACQQANQVDSIKSMIKSSIEAKFSNILDDSLVSEFTDDLFKEDQFHCPFPRAYVHAFIQKHKIQIDSLKTLSAELISLKKKIGNQSEGYIRQIEDSDAQILTDESLIQYKKAYNSPINPTMGYASDYFITDLITNENRVDIINHFATKDVEGKCKDNLHYWLNSMGEKNLVDLLSNQRLSVKGRQFLLDNYFYTERGRALVKDHLKKREGLVKHLDKELANFDQIDNQIENTIDLKSNQISEDLNKDIGSIKETVLKQLLNWKSKDDFTAIFNQIKDDIDKEIIPLYSGFTNHQKQIKKIELLGLAINMIRVLTEDNILARADNGGSFLDELKKEISHTENLIDWIDSIVELSAEELSKLSPQEKVDLNTKKHYFIDAFELGCKDDKSEFFCRVEKVPRVQIQQDVLSPLPPSDPSDPQGLHRLMQWASTSHKPHTSTPSTPRTPS